MMTPLTASVCYVVLNEIAGRRITDAKSVVHPERFRTRLFYYAIGKLVFTVLGLLLVVVGF